MKPGKAFIRAFLVLTGVAMAGLWAMKPSPALQAVPPIDVESFRESWRVLDPITARNLTIYPVVSDLKADTSEFLTLDDGVATGEVRIAERGALENGMIRRRPVRRWPPVESDVVPSEYQGASVNELVLVNGSSRPLILLAGEVVSGGKQNRIIGMDLIVPPKSDPVPLTVFCVEHGRWSSGPTAFGTGGAIAHPSIRAEAEFSKNQSGVWDKVGGTGAAMGVPSPTQSYMDIVTSPKAKHALEAVEVPIEREFEQKLREAVGRRGAVGAVVAINGQLVWCDVFPSAELFRKYWPKLLRSYVVEAQSQPGVSKTLPGLKEAEAFLEAVHGHVTVESQPGVFRRTEIAASGFQVEALEALEGKADSGLLIHYNKMARD
jgi:ARG/rhodanese/phosphatase superfamily protein